jgi:hypothetical protein
MLFNVTTEGGAFTLNNTRARMYVGIESRVYISRVCILFGAWDHNIDPVWRGVYIYGPMHYFRHAVRYLDSARA